MCYLKIRSEIGFKMRIDPLKFFRLKQPLGAFVWDLKGIILCMLLCSYKYLIHVLRIQYTPSRMDLFHDNTYSPVDATLVWKLVD